MVHWIDVGQWLLGLDHPEKATAFGEHFASKDVWQTPDTIQCLLSYPGEVQAHFEGTFSNARNAARIEFLGTEGSIWVDRGGYVLYPERGKGEAESMILGTDPRRGLDFYDKPDGEALHLADWLEAIRSRQQALLPGRGRRRRRLGGPPGQPGLSRGPGSPAGGLGRDSRRILRIGNGRSIRYDRAEISPADCRSPPP